MCPALNRQLLIMCNSAFPILLLTVIIKICSMQQVVYVISSNSTQAEHTTCPARPCHDIDYYVLYPTYLTSNTVFYFMPGIHITSLTIGTNFDFIRNLTLCGTGKLETVVAMVYKRRLFLSQY